MTNRLDPSGYGFPSAEPSITSPSFMFDALDETVVRLPCYEPPGFEVQLSGRALCTHSTLVGASGSGKTSALRWFIKQFISHKSDTSGQSPGLFVFDFNADDTIPLIKKWASEAGREKDLRILSPHEGHLELFAAIRELEDLPAATSSLMHGAWAVHHGDHAYWTETCRVILNAALTICLVVEGEIKVPTVLRFVVNWLINHDLDHQDREFLASFEKICAGADQYLDQASVTKLQVTRATIQMWTKLDARTKSILTSMFLDALSPLCSPEVRRYLDEKRLPAFVPEELALGRIMVYSMPAVRQPEVASLLGRVVKSRLWSSLQERPQDRNQRLCAIVVDEYHFVASGGPSRASDVTALATLRSRSVAVVTATQSLNHLIGSMGLAQFQALLPNFGNFFFFRSAEEYTGRLAEMVMGERDCPTEEATGAGGLWQAEPAAAKREKVCPVGSLTELEPCQAYVSAAGYRSLKPLWLAANHERAFQQKRPVAEAKRVTQLDKLRAFTEVRNHPSRQAGSDATDAFSFTTKSPKLFYDLDCWKRLLARRRFQSTPYLSFGDFRDAFRSMGHQPVGLETLPLVWWQALVRLTAAFSRKHPFNLLGLTQEDGCIEVLLTGKGPLPYEKWVASLERALYPIRTRPLKKRDLRLLEIAEVDDEATGGDMDEPTE